MLLCRATAAYHRRADVVFVPVDGLPDSALGLVWRRGGETEAVREFARTVAEADRPGRRLSGGPHYLSGEGRPTWKDGVTDT
jgi:hypothetical protein